MAIKSISNINGMGESIKKTTANNETVSVNSVEGTKQLSDLKSTAKHNEPVEILDLDDTLKETKTEMKDTYKIVDNISLNEQVKYGPPPEHKTDQVLNPEDFKPRKTPQELFDETIGEQQRRERIQAEVEAFRDKVIHTHKDN